LNEETDTIAEVIKLAAKTKRGGELPPPRSFHNRAPGEAKTTD
jgi:hypothetical protein